MPNRIIREGILTSARIAKLGWAEEVLFRRLMSIVDDYGRYYADVGMLRAACYPRQINKVSDADVGKWMRCLAEAGLVSVYPAEDGERYLEVLHFNQQVRAKKSKFPDVCSKCEADATQALADEHLVVFGDVDVSECVDVVVVGPPKVGDRPAKRCPESFVVTDELRQWAAREVPGVDCDRQTAAMRDHTYPKAKTDWPATWRSWMRIAFDRLPRQRSPPIPFPSKNSEQLAGLTGRNRQPTQETIDVDATEVTARRLG